MNRAEAFNAFMEGKTIKHVDWYLQKNTAIKRQDEGDVGLSWLKNRKV